MSLSSTGVLLQCYSFNISFFLIRTLS